MMNARDLAEPFSGKTADVILGSFLVMVAFHLLMFLGIALGVSGGAGLHDDRFRSRWHPALPLEDPAPRPRPEVCVGGPWGRA
jgi:hypothetical protein